MSLFAFLYLKSWLSMPASSYTVDGDPQLFAEGERLAFYAMQDLQVFIGNFKLTDAPGNIETLEECPCCFSLTDTKVFLREQYFLLAYICTVLLSSKRLHGCLWPT